MSVISSLQGNAVVWVVLSICTLLGVPAFIFTVYTWMVGKRKKEFTYAKISHRIIDAGVSSINSIKVLFNDNPIPNLTVTRFAVWNSGNEEIKKEDLYSERPLRIKSNDDDSKILDASIIKGSDPEQKFRVSAVEKDVIVEFECAEKEDGVVIQVIHTGYGGDIMPTVGIMGGSEVKEYQTVLFHSLIWRFFQKNSMKAYVALKKASVVYFGIITIFSILFGFFMFADTFRIIELPFSLTSPEADRIATIAMIPICICNLYFL